jgi:ribosomal protein S18 acetylase RimI-like enzyme
MATSEMHQGKGLGRKLLRSAEERLQEMGVDVLWCNARTNARGFYEKLGYQVMGPSFDIPEIGRHYKMFKRFE